MRRTRRWGLLCVFLVLALATPMVSEAPFAGRVVAVGDIHADLPSFLMILQKAGLVNASRTWIGGKTILVQTGDSIDRGPDMRGVLDLLMALEKQAKSRGGQAVTLLGNHEVMNIMGDLRYVTPQNYASFADANSEKRRTKAWEDYVKWRQRRAKDMGLPEPVIAPESQKAWMDGHPPGFFEHREAFGPRGVYGKWLRQRPAIFVMDGTVFLHGGIAPELKSWKLDALNQRIQDELKAFDNTLQYLQQMGLILPFFTVNEMAAAVQAEVDFRNAGIEAKRAQAAADGKTYEVPAEERQHLDVLKDFLNFPSWFSVHPQGPLWFRGYDDWSDEEGPAKVQELLTAFGVNRFVVGHSPQKGGSIRVRFDGAVFLIDTGLYSAHYKGGRASALEMDKGSFTAVYPEERIVLVSREKTAVPGNGGSDSALEEVPGGGWEPQSSPGGQTSQVVSKPGAQPPPASPRRASLPARIWLGPDGRPLPFQNDEEVLEFLRTAEVVSRKSTGLGINTPDKVRLRKDGIEMNAVFREVNVEKDMATMAGGRRELFFRDSYIFEVAAYELARLLGLDNVPPVVERKLNGVKGSLQLWIENAFTETKRQKEKIPPKDSLQWNYQVQLMRMFDSLVYNTDRNMGNVLIDPQWKLWMVDHTRAFRRYTDPKNPEAVVLIEREVWQKLQTVDDQTIRDRLKATLRKYEIEGLLDRRRKLVAHIRKRIAEVGEERALFTWESAHVAAK